MAIFTEREALKEQLSTIREERNELRKLYREMVEELHSKETELLSRLRELDDRDIQNSDAPGVYDIQGLLSDLSNTILHLKDLVPQVPVKVLLEEVKSHYTGKDGQPVVLEEIQNKVLNNPKFKEEVLNSVARENASKGINAKKRDEEKAKIRFSGKKAAPIIRQYLKEQGKPVALKTLINILDAYGFEKASNSTERIRSIMNADSRIKLATRGYYQFVE